MLASRLVVRIVGWCNAVRRSPLSIVVRVNGRGLQDSERGRGHQVRRTVFAEIADVGGKIQVSGRGRLPRSCDTDLFIAVVTADRAVESSPACGSWFLARSSRIATVSAWAQLAAPATDKLAALLSEEIAM